MSTITTILPTPPNGFSTQISTSSVSSSDLSIELDSTSGLGTEGVGQLLKKDADGNLVAGSVEFVHWTNVSGNTITFSDTGDRGITGSDSGAQSYVADDYFEVWVSSYYTPSGIREQINDTNGNEQIKLTATASAVNEITVTNAATGNAPEISATGGDTNIDLKLKGKGTGHAQAYDNYSASYFDLVPNSSMARQAIMNGNFDVWQRGTSFTAASGYSADRWYYALSGATGTVSRQAFTLGQTDVPNEPKYYLRMAVTAADDNVNIEQRIEGVRTFAGQKATVSFWAKADTNRDWTIRFRQLFGTGGSPSETVDSDNTVSITTSWAKYTVTQALPSVSGKTLGTAGDDYLAIGFLQPTNTTFTLELAQVQLCAGEVALPFQPKSYAQELADCQRYCFVHTTSQNSEVIGNGGVISTTVARIVLQLPVELRTLPTLTATAGDWQVEYGATAADVTTIAIATNQNSTRSPSIDATVASGLTVGQYAKIRGDGSSGRILVLSAEL